MLSKIIAFAAIAVCAAIKVELSDEKTPYDYVKERLDAIGTDMRTGLPLSDSYEVEESEDYPEQIEGAASSVLNTVSGIGGAGVGGIGLGQGLGQGIGLGGLGYGGIGIGQGLGQGLGIGLGGLGGVGGLGVGGFGGAGIGGAGVGNVGLINPGLGGIGAGGIGLGGGLGGGYGGGILYHPLLGAQVGGGYVDKKAYDEAQKKGADENLEKIEKKAEEETKHGQEGFQQAAAAAKAEKGESSFYKDEEAKKKAVGDEKFYEGAQKFDKKGKFIIPILDFIPQFGK